MGTKRIEFIDLAKGVGITLIVIGHCGVDFSFPGLYAGAVMPWFFVLSGIFYKDESFISYVKKKTNSILIPFLFFYLTSYVLFYILKLYAPQMLEIMDAKGVNDIFCNRQYFNGPIWFLIALFWCGIIFSGISNFIKSDYLRIIVVVILGSLGLYLGSVKFFLPAFLDVALTALPFYAFGYLLKRTSILYPNKYDKYNMLFFVTFYIISVIISYLFSNVGLHFHYNEVNGIAESYVLALTSLFALLFICKLVKHLPIVSYLGRYSLIILCTHHMVYRPLTVIYSRLPFEFMHSSWFLALTTLLVCWALIPLCIRFIPYFVAQKDLIKWNKK